VRIASRQRALGMEFPRLIAVNVRAGVPRVAMVEDCYGRLLLKNGCGRFGIDLITI
jgi:hypothetical protein